MRYLTIIPILLFFLAFSNAVEVNLQNLTIPNIDDVAVIRERCDSKGGNGTYENVKLAKTQLQQCVEGLMDFNVIKDEVEEAKKTGSMDEVFGKYCAKRPIVKNCVMNFTNAIQPCLESHEKDALNLTLEIIRQLGDFVCFRDGDRIAMFVAEGGVECLKEHVEGIKSCVNTTFKINPQTQVNSLDFPNLLIDKQKCDELGKLQECTVAELEKCKDSTPANIVDALFRFVKRSACNNKSKRSITFHSIFKRSTLTPFFDNSTIAKNNILKLIEKSCDKNGGKGIYDVYVATAEKAENCFHEKQKSKTNRVFLKDVKKRIQKCTEDLAEIAQLCLAAEEKYLPQFFLDIIYSLLDFAYAYKDKIFPQPHRHGQFAICLNDIRKSNNSKLFSETLTPSLNFNNVLTRDVICNQMKNTMNIVEGIVGQSCSQENSTKELKMAFVEAFLAPCQKKP